MSRFTKKECLDCSAMSAREPGRERGTEGLLPDVPASQLQPRIQHSRTELCVSTALFGPHRITEMHFGALVLP